MKQHFQGIADTLVPPQMSEIYHLPYANKICRYCNTFLWQLHNPYLWHPVNEAHLPQIPAVL